jgi:hypothetical protein
VFERKAEELKYYNEVAQKVTDIIVCDGIYSSPKEGSESLIEYDLVKLAEFCKNQDAFEKIEKARKKLSLPESNRLKTLIQEADGVEEREALMQRWKTIQVLYPGFKGCYGCHIRENSYQKIYDETIGNLPDVSHDGLERKTSRDAALETYPRTEVTKFTNLKLARSCGKDDLQKISDFERDANEWEPSKWDFAFSTCSEKRAEIEKGVAEIENMENEFNLYRNLAYRAVDEYICGGSKYVSPVNPNPLTAKDFEKLAELDKRLRNTDNGLKNIEKIRKRLSEHERQKPSIAFAKPKETISEVRNAEIGATADMSATSNTSPSARKGLQAYLHKAQKEGSLTGEKEKSKQIKTKETPEKAAPDRDDH